MNGITNMIIHAVFIGQICLLIPCVNAQSNDIALKNSSLTPYLFQFGFGQELVLAKNDADALAMLNNPVIKSENQEIIPSFYLGFRINAKFGLQAAYNGIWKSTAAAGYAGTYYDPGGSYGYFSLLDQLFEALGIEIPDDYYTPSEPGWRNIADGSSCENWTDLYSLRLSYNIFENKRFRTSILAGPAIAVSYESVSLYAQGIYMSGDYTFVDNQSDHFEDRYTNLSFSAGARVECKFLRRMSLMAFVDGGIPVKKSRTSEHAIEVMHDDAIKQLTLPSHEIDTRSFRAGLGLLAGIF